MPDGLQTLCLDLVLAARQWRRLADAVARPYGLSESTALPLVMLARRGGMHQAALAEAIGVEGPSLVRTLDQLCALGLVRRQTDPSDRRAKSLSLTPRGRRLTVRLSVDLDALRARVFARAEAGDIEAAGRVLTRLAGSATMPAPADDTGADAP